jgi:hypothetical protein
LRQQFLENELQSLARRESVPQKILTLTRWLLHLAA